MAHIHSVYDSDKHFSIDPLTRELKNETPGKACIMQYDHNSERITFDLPMTVEGHRMIDCNRVEVHYLNIDAQTKQQNGDVYDVVDLMASPADPEVAICSWLIDGKATQLFGPLWFRLRFVCSSAGEVDYAWHTAIYKGLTVSDGIMITPIIEEEYSDILAAFDERIKALEQGGSGSDSGQNANKALTFTGAVSATYDGTKEVTVNIPTGGAGGGLTDTEKSHLLTILDAVIVETTKQPVVAEALAALKQLWSGGEVYVSQIGTTLALENVTAVTSITQTGTMLALA